MRVHERALRGLSIGLLSLSVLALTQCRAADVETIPPGAWLVGQAAPIRVVLERLAALPGTPLGDFASRAAARLPRDCTRFVARADDADPDALIDSIRCDALEPPPAQLEALRADSALAFALPLRAGTRLIGRGEISPDGSVAIDTRLDGPADSGWIALLVPSAEDAGSPRLSGHDSLLHARIRPAVGLDLARAVPEESQADALFRLKSRLFAGTVLGDAWEVAVYAPQPGQTVPGIALALDIARPQLAAGAARDFVASLEATWPLRHAPVRIADHDGVCFPDVRILPEFAPCYALVADTLVIGWNAESIAHALDPTPEPTLGRAGGLVIHLDRLSDADARMRGDDEDVAPRPPATPAPQWDRLAIRRRAAEGARSLRLELTSQGDAS